VRNLKSALAKSIKRRVDATQVMIAASTSFLSVLSFENLNFTSSCSSPIAHLRIRFCCVLAILQLFFCILGACQEGQE
jgi:hypothetical protein